MAQHVTPLNIKDQEAYGMAKELSRLTGKTLTEVVREALRERLAKEQRSKPDPYLKERLLEIARQCAALPVLDPRSAEEIIGYDEWGVPR